MDKTYESTWVNKVQLTLSVLINAIFGGAAAMLVMNALNRGETWYFIGESLVLNYVGLYLIGLVFSGGYFARDYYNIKDLKVSFTETMIKFDRHYSPREYFINDLRDFRVSSVIYGWFGLRKLIFRFKDRRDHRKYSIFLILKKDEVGAFEEALLEARKRAYKQTQ